MVIVVSTSFALSGKDGVWLKVVLNSEVLTFITYPTVIYVVIEWLSVPP